VQTTDWRSVVLFSKLPLWAYVVVTTGLAVFLTATLLPTLVFNFHDDFLVYLPRIVRMRQAGSLGGNPFEQFGLSDFGVQAFFKHYSQLGFHSTVPSPSMQFFALSLVSG
jgi:hypothetical protein